MLNHEKISFLNLPTPLEYLKNMSEDLGVELYIKRDDLTGLGAGGNKLRKLEYLLKDALDKGATTLVTVGGAQTNHGRLTAAVAAKYGLKCTIISGDDYPGEVSANILLDRIMGAELILHKGGNGNLKEMIKTVMARLKEEGEIPYYIPMGGSNTIGALGYYECAKELTSQISDARVVVTCGSLGTYMGLFCGLHGSSLSLTGVSIGPIFPNYLEAALAYFAEVKADWKLDFNVGLEDFHIVDGSYDDYNNPVMQVREDIYHMARREAILLDPCYTGKTFTAMKKLIQYGIIKKGEKIVFVHTGGFPGLYTPHHRIEMEEELRDGINFL